MKAIHYYIGMAGAAALLLSSCVKDELHDTPHPDHGKVAVTADWANRGENIPVPEKWTVSIGEYTGEETAATHAPDYLFEPGGYTLAAYNEPEGITISGTAAAADTDPDNAGCITGQPEWLFTSVQEISINKDRDHEFTARMKQQVRELTLVVEPTGDAAGRITEGAYRSHYGDIERRGRHTGFRHGHPRQTLERRPDLHEGYRRDEHRQMDGHRAAARYRRGAADARGHYRLHRRHPAADDARKRPLGEPRRLQHG